MKTEVLIYESNNKVIAFEPEKMLPNKFIKAKDWLNSIALRTGSFSQYMFNPDLCRQPTDAEYNDYIQLKDHSLFTLNAS